MIRREPMVALTLLGIALLLALFVLYPVVSILCQSRLSLDRAFVRPFLNSLILGLFVSVVSTVIGYFFAYIVARTDVPLKGLFRAMTTFPLISPPFILALSTIILLGRQGFLTQLLFPGSDFSIYGFWGISLVQVFSLFPLAYLVCHGAIATIDPSIEEASINQGASGPRTFLKVTLPLSLPGILSALLLTFFESLADFGTPLVLAGNFRVLCVESYLKIVGAEQELAGGSALALLLLVPALTAFFVQRYWIEKRSYATLLGKPSTARIHGVGLKAKVFFVTIGLLITSLTILLYGTVLFGAVTRVWGADHSLTLSHFATTFREATDTITNSFILALVAAPLSGLLGIAIAYLLERKRFFGKGAIEVASLLNFAIPGTVIGIGYLVAFNHPPLVLTGGWLIIVLLFVFRNMPVGLRAGISSLKQIDRGIEEAAQSLGASSFRIFRTITLPLLKPAFFSGLAFSFIKCMVAISAVIFVVSGRWNLITIAILGYVETGELSQAAALSVMLVLVLCLVVGVLRLMIRGRSRQFVRFT